MTSQTQLSLMPHTEWLVAAMVDSMSQGILSGEVHWMLPPYVPPKAPVAPGEEAT